MKKWEVKIYLRVTISGVGGCDDKIEQRIGAAARVVGAMRKEVLERRELQKKTENESI